MMVITMVVQDTEVVVTVVVVVVVVTTVVDVTTDTDHVDLNHQLVKSLNQPSTLLTFHSS
jgi:hypothetical protein